MQAIAGLEGMVVIDVVEGTALSSLPYMATVLKQRPSSFDSQEAAVHWARRSGETTVKPYWLMCVDKACFSLHNLSVCKCASYICVCCLKAALPTGCSSEYGMQICLESHTSCYAAVKHGVAVICVTSAKTSASQNHHILQKRNSSQVSVCLCRHVKKHRSSKHFNPVLLNTGGCRYSQYTEAACAYNSHLKGRSCLHMRLVPSHKSAHVLHEGILDQAIVFSYTLSCCSCLCCCMHSSLRFPTYITAEDVHVSCQINHCGQ